MTRKIFRFNFLLFIFFSSLCQATDLGQTPLSNQSKQSADLIIFSYNRPMQLYALLKSTSLHISNLNQIFVLYRVGNSEFDDAYQKLQLLFPHIQFVKQGSEPRQDFKPLLLQCINATDAEYIVFAVDDDVVKEPFDVQECVETMKQSAAYCFFLRLGENIRYTYRSYDPIPPPPAMEIKRGILKYYMDDAYFGDWRYCNNLDMTIYKKETIYPFLSSNSYSSPNTLESNWAGVMDLHAYGLFFKNSKMFAVPINIVQEDWVCPNEGSFSAQELFELWNLGFEIDLEPYFSLNNPCPFVSLKPTFKKRELS